MTSAKRSKTVDDLMRGALWAALQQPMAFLEGKRILLVDDEPTNLGRLTGLLRTIGGDDLEVSSARTADAALDICLGQHGRFDVVLLNHLLQTEDDGFALLGDLRRAGLSGSARTVLYAETMSHALRREAKAAGFDDTIHLDDMDAATLSMMLLRLVAPVPPAA